MTLLMDRPAQPEEQPTINGRPGRVRMVQQDDRKFTKLREALIPTWEEGAVYNESLKPHQPNQSCLEKASWCQSISSEVVKCGDNSCGKVHAPGDTLRRICHQRFHPLCMGAVCAKPLWKKQSIIEEHASQIRILQVGVGSYTVSNSNKTLRERQESINLAVDRVYQWCQELAKHENAPYFVKNSFIAPRADLYKDFLTLEVMLLGVVGEGDTLDDAIEFIGQHFAATVDRDLVSGVRRDVTVEVVDVLDTGEPVTTAERIIRAWGKMLSIQVYWDDADGFLSLLTAFKGRRLVQPRGLFYAYPKATKKRDDANRDSPSRSESLLASTLLHFSEFDPMSEDRGHGADGFIPSAPPDCAFCGAKTRWIGPTQGPWVKTKALHSAREVWLRLKVLR